MVKFRKRAEKKSTLKKQDDSKVLPMPATRTRSQLVSLFTFTTEAETRDEEEILQPVATKSYDVEPQEDVHVAEGWNTDTNTDTDNTESMIHALRSKLGLNQCCVDEDDVDYDVLVESEGNKEEKPQQHEKIVMQTDGSLSFLIFSRFAVVEESTHLLIKVRVGCLIHSCIIQLCYLSITYNIHADNCFLSYSGSHIHSRRRQKVRWNWSHSSDASICPWANCHGNY